MKRFESKDSLYSANSSTNDLNHIGGLHSHNNPFDGVHMAIDLSDSVEANGIGRIEIGPWEREAVAHASAVQRGGWCC